MIFLRKCQFFARSGPPPFSRNFACTAGTGGTGGGGEGGAGGASRRHFFSENIFFANFYISFTFLPHFPQYSTVFTVLGAVSIPRMLRVSHGWSSSSTPGVTRPPRQLICSRESMRSAKRMLHAISKYVACQRFLVPGGWSLQKGYCGEQAVESNPHWVGMHPLDGDVGPGPEPFWIASSIGEPFSQGI